MFELSIIAGIVLLLGILLLIVILRQRRHLPTSVRKRLREQWERVRAIPDDHRRMIDAESVLYQAFDALGYAGSFAEKLKAAGPRMGHSQALWDAHKLRNRIAHEPGTVLARNEAERAWAAFERTLESLL